MGYTDTYKFGFLEPFQKTRLVLTLDEQRFTAIENQLQHLYSLFGNGVLVDGSDDESWNLSGVPGNVMKIRVSPGNGHVNYNYAETTISVDLDLVRPVGASEVQYWVYATPNATTSDQRTVDFVVSLTEINQPDLFIGLGGAILRDEPDGNGGTVTKLYIYNDADHGRVEISLFATLARIVNAHRHIGGLNNPSPINLGAHVQGKLSGDFLTDLDLGAVTAGVLNPDRLPQISHNSLIDIGTLPHPQIETLIADLQYSKDSRLSDFIDANVLQLAINLKRMQGDLLHIDRTLRNALLYIPGISPQAFEANTTADPTNNVNDVDPNTLDGDGNPVVLVVPDSTELANIDRINNYIEGTFATAVASEQVTWTTDTDFNNEFTRATTGSGISATYPTHDVESIGSGAPAYITADRPTLYQRIAEKDITPWKSGIALTDKAGVVNIPPPAFVDNINSAPENQGLRRYLYYEIPSGQNTDWTNQQKIAIAYGLDTDSEPGNVYFFLILKTGGTNVVFNLTSGGTSKTLGISQTVLLRAANTTNTARTLKVFNLSSFVTDAANLGEVLGIGIYYQTASGWDTSRVQFSLISPTSSEIEDYALSPSIDATRVITAREGSIPADTTGAVFIWNETLFAATARQVFRYQSSSSSTRFASAVVDIPAGYENYVRVRTRATAASSQSSLETATAFDVKNGYLIAGGSSLGKWIDIIVDISTTLDRTVAGRVNSVVLTFETPSADQPERTYDTQGAWQDGRTQINTIAGGDDTLRIADTSQVGNFLYATGNSVKALYGLVGSTATDLPLGQELYLAPAQVFANSTTHGFSGPRDLYFKQNGNVVIADTLNDRLVEVSSTGTLIRSIQGNVRLRRINRDFVLLMAAYNPRLGKMWLAFSQNVTPATITNISIVSGNQVIGFNTTDANTVLHAPIDGKSATLEVQFSAAYMARLNGFSGPWSVIVPSSAVTRVDVSTGGTPGVPPGSTSGGGTTTPPPYGTGLPDFVKLPLPLFRLFRGLTTEPWSLGTADTLKGTYVCQIGLNDVDTSTDSVEGDFDGDGQITTTLQGPGGQIGSVTMGVTVGEIVFDNLFEPVSLQVQSDDKWVVGAIGSSTGICYTTLGTRAWEITRDIAALQEGLMGGVWELEGSTVGLVLVSTPIPATDGATQGQVVVLARKQNNQVISRINVAGDVIRAIPEPDGLKYLVLIDDRLNNGKQSRLIKVNSAGTVKWDLVNKPFSRPKGLRVLVNGHILVSE